MKTSKPSFLSLAKDPTLDQETAFTICRITDMAGGEVTDVLGWDWLEKCDGDYKSLIDLELFKKAWAALEQKDWLSLQTTNDVDKPISTIKPLEDLKNLRVLILQNNLIQDLRPLSEMGQLRELSCFRNLISDLSPLEKLQALEELSLGENPVSSFRVLEKLPALKKLSLSVDQCDRFTDCKCLLRLSSLNLAFSDTRAIKNFNDWPEMPSLKTLKADDVKNLSGVERFSTLQTLTLCESEISCLEPLKNLKALTHLIISTSKAIDLKPLSELYALRSVSINSPKTQGLSVLSKLPALHEISVEDKTSSTARELKILKKDLTSWAIEFKTEKVKKQPSLELETVDQTTFDRYDTKQPYGISDGESNEGMLASEHTWLVGEISALMKIDFKSGKDFVLPYTSGFRRSERIIIYSIPAYEAFREIVLAVQRLLCETKNDWIIYFQSLLGEGEDMEEIPEEIEDFTVWIYPNKIMVAKEQASIVRKLIDWNR